jgi:CRP/FNR family transcriptional regulator, cyclic AMP receptor protein
MFGLCSPSVASAVGNCSPDRTEESGVARVEGVFRNAQQPARQLQAGEVVFTEGDVGAEMFGIVDGSVELTVAGRPIAVLGADDVFGEMALIDARERMATATATSPTTVVSIDRSDFLFLVHETPMFALQVMSALADRLRKQA